MDREVVAPETGKEGYSSLEEGYRQMAADEEREAEAEEWSEGLIGDAYGCTEVFLRIAPGRRQG